MQHTLLILSTILALFAPIAYIASILRGNSKPHRTTRFILFFALTLNFISIVAAHGNLGAKIFAGIDSVQSLIIFCLSLFFGLGGSDIFDWLCLVAATIALIVWQITGDPILAVWLSIVANLIAYLPAFVKTWKRPETESPWVYVFSILAAGFGLAAYKLMAVSAFQIYIILCCSVMLICMYHKRLHIMVRASTHGS